MLDMALRVMSCMEGSIPVYTSEETFIFFLNFFFFFAANTFSSLFFQF